MTQYNHIFMLEEGTSENFSLSRSLSISPSAQNYKKKKFCIVMKVLFCQFFASPQCGTAKKTENVLSRPNLSHFSASPKSGRGCVAEKMNRILPLFEFLREELNQELKKHEELQISYLCLNLSKNIQTLKLKTIEKWIININDTPILPSISCCNPPTSRQKDGPRSIIEIIEIGVFSQKTGHKKKTQVSTTEAAVSSDRSYMGNSNRPKMPGRKVRTRASIIGSSVESMASISSQASSIKSNSLNEEVEIHEQESTANWDSSVDLLGHSSVLAETTLEWPSPSGKLRFLFSRDFLETLNEEKISEDFNREDSIVENKKQENLQNSYLTKFSKIITSSLNLNRFNENYEAKFRKIQNNDRNQIEETQRTYIFLTILKNIPFFVLSKVETPETADRFNEIKYHFLQDEEINPKLNFYKLKVNHNLTLFKETLNYNNKFADCCFDNEITGTDTDASLNDRRSEFLQGRPRTFGPEIFNLEMGASNRSTSTPIHQNPEKVEAAVEDTEADSTVEPEAKPEAAIDPMVDPEPEPEESVEANPPREDNIIVHHVGGCPCQNSEAAALAIKEEGMPMPDPIAYGHAPENNNNNMRVYAGIIGSERDPRLNKEPHLEAGLELPEEEEETDPLQGGPTPPKNPRLSRPKVRWIGHICPNCTCNPQGQWAWHESCILEQEEAEPEQEVAEAPVTQGTHRPRNPDFELTHRAAARPIPGAARGRRKPIREVAGLNPVPTGNGQAGGTAPRGVPDPYYACRPKQVGPQMATPIWPGGQDQEQEEAEPEPEIQIIDMSEVWYLQTIKNLEVIDYVDNLKIVKEVITIDDSTAEEEEPETDDENESAEEWYELGQCYNMYNVK